MLPEEQVEEDMEQPVLLTLEQLIAEVVVEEHKQHPEQEALE